MSFNLAWILVGATALSGLIWFADRLLWARDRSQRAAELAAAGGVDRRTAEAAIEPWWVENARSFFPVLLFVLVLRSFIVEPFRIPSGSMMPTLLIGDFILVNKFAYGLRLPISHLEILSLGEPERGDVAVFRFPRDPRVDYIKRVIGLPGDRISYIGKRLYINGQPVPQTLLGDYQGDDARPGTLQFEEDLLGRPHATLKDGRPVIGLARDLRDIVVPAGHYFMMGDNRDNSNDSRVWGFVPRENLVGRAFFIWLNARRRDGLDFDFDWRRIGNSVD